MLNNEEIEALLGIQTMTCKKLADQSKLANRYREVYNALRKSLKENEGYIIEPLDEGDK